MFNAFLLVQRLPAKEFMRENLQKEDANTRWCTVRIVLELEVVNLENETVAKLRAARTCRVCVTDTY